MSDVVNDSVQCPCGYIFHGDDLDQKSGERKPCPKCGSLKRIFNVEARDGIALGDSVSGVHEAHMSPQSWTIFGLILGFIIPPIFYAVFSILTICFWYKLLIWLGVILIAFYLTRSYTIIRLLRFIADKAYGKRKFS
jgi:uncharacterized protein (DUF983 family)